MSEWKKKVKYYVKSGDGYLTQFEGGLPVLANSKDLAREFTDLEVAEASANKIIEAGFQASIELDEELVLDE